jgi:hypothetical protein
MGHLNLHYLSPEDAESAARLMEILGFVRTQEMPLPRGGTFFRFTLNGETPTRGDAIVYLSTLPGPLAQLRSAIREALGADGASPHPAVVAAREGLAHDPEQNLHLGVLFSSLDALEAAILKLKALAGGEFEGRMSFVMNRPRNGVPEVDARLDASPIYAGVQRYTFGKNGVQAFVVTDIVVTGPLAENMVFELDYVFSGYEDHILSFSTSDR